MLFRPSRETSSIVSVLVLFFLLFSPVFSSNDFGEENETSTASNTLKKTKLINARLRKINKPFLKSIKSPDGDIIDCVLFHLQPAFDRPEIRETMPLIPPELPKGYDNTGKNSEIKQLWNSKGESCPNGTIPIRRTSASEISSPSIFKSRKRDSRKGTLVPSEHEHAVGYVKDGDYYGGKATISVWQPSVNEDDFSLAQMWVVSEIPNHPINTIEVGWHVYPRLYKDSRPRLFTYWTPDNYRSGCYNLRCSGFVQTSQKIILGAAFAPISKYNGDQFDVTFMIWKDKNRTKWWLKVGRELVGYWPTTLFTDLGNHATVIEYGGEVYSPTSSRHTSTQMGSGHFQDEGFRKAAFVSNLDVVDQRRHLNAASGLSIIVDKPNCYGAKSGFSDEWGNYIYFGGPGYGPNCP